MILLKGGLHRFDIWKKASGDAQNNQFIKTITLDLTNGPDFFFLEFKPERLRQKVIDYSINSEGLPKYLQKFKGWFINAGLDFSDLASDTLTALIGELMDFQETNEYLYDFYPFANDLTFHFWVLDDTDSLMLKEIEEGYEGLYLRFISQDVITKLKLYSQAQLAATYGGEHKLPATGEIET